MGVHDNMYIHVRTDGRGGRVRRRQRIPYNVMTTAGTVATWKEASVSALLARGPGCTAAANGSITHNAVAVATGAAEAEARRGGLSLSPTRRTTRCGAQQRFLIPRGDDAHSPRPKPEHLDDDGCLGRQQTGPR